MADALISPLLTVLAGGALGLVFFGGLWWTVRRAATARHPGLLVLLSLLLRSGFTLAGFFALAGGQWQRWLLCLLGFVAARAATRVAVGRWARAHQARPPPALAASGDRHAA